jgi:hypothetical protein
MDKIRGINCILKCTQTTECHNTKFKLAVSKLPQELGICATLVTAIFVQELPAWSANSNCNLRYLHIFEEQLRDFFKNKSIRFMLFI